MQRPCSYMPYHLQSTQNRLMISDTLKELYLNDFQSFKTAVSYQLGHPSLFRLDQITTNSFSVSYTMFADQTLTLLFRQIMLESFSRYYPTSTALAVCNHKHCICFYVAFSTILPFSSELPLFPPGYSRYEAPLVTYPSQDSILHHGTYQAFRDALMLQFDPPVRIEEQTLVSPVLERGISEASQLLLTPIRMVTTIMDESEYSDFIGNESQIEQSVVFPYDLTLNNLLEVFQCSNSLYFAEYMRRFTSTQIDCLSVATILLQHS